jgi:hypothetical protein
MSGPPPGIDGILARFGRIYISAMPSRELGIAFVDLSLQLRISLGLDGE